METALGYVLGAYPQLSESFVVEEVRELCRQGCEPRVVAMFPGDGALDGAPPAGYLGDPTVAQQARALATSIATRPLRTALALVDRRRRLGAGVRETLRLLPHARGLKAARHLHAHFATDPASFAYRLAALTGASFSVSTHAYDVHLPHAHARRKLAAARFVVVHSDYHARLLSERQPELGSSLRVVRPGVDLEKFRRSGAYAPNGPLVCVARLVPKKGLDVLIEAVAQAHHWLPPVVIVGDGPERARLETLASGSGIRFAGALAHGEIPGLLEGASALVLPCLELPNGDRDGSPTVILEAMAMELPVVSTAVAAIPELVAADRGTLVAPGRADELTGALTALFARPAEERVRMGRRGRAFVERRHSLEAHAAELRRLFAAAAAP